MYDSIIALGLTVATICAGLMAGVYFAFSSFIMRSLDQLGATQAVETMNVINKVILRSWFMVPFFGSTLLYLVLAAIAVLDPDLAGRWLLFAAGMIYIAGMFVCTAGFNVPLNKRLAQVNGGNTAKANGWAYYFRRWTRWNHIRSISSLVVLTLSIHYLANHT